MQRWLHIAHRIDRFSERTGQVLYWLTLLMIVVGAYNAIVRYAGRFTGVNLSSNTFIELQWYAFSFVFLLGAAYTLKHNAHVRVDVLYGQLSAKGQAWINVLGTVLFLFPFCLLMLWLSARMVTTGAWTFDEMSPDPGGLPRFPVKVAIPIGFLLLLVQGIALLIKQVAILRGVNPAWLHPDGLYPNPSKEGT